MLSRQAKPTVFHYFLDRLAGEDRLLRHYTQNIDCIDQQLPALRQKIVQLHGRIDQVRCQSCRWSGQFLPEQFQGQDIPTCDQCQSASSKRQRAGKRALGIGKLRPNILLYGEDNPESLAIGEIAEQDM